MDVQMVEPVRVTCPKPTRVCWPCLLAPVACSLGLHALIILLVMEITIDCPRLPEDILAYRPLDKAATIPEGPDRIFSIVLLDPAKPQANSSTVPAGDAREDADPGNVPAFNLTGRLRRGPGWMLGGRPDYLLEDADSSLRLCVLVGSQDLDLERGLGQVVLVAGPAFRKGLDLDLFDAHALAVFAPEVPTRGIFTVRGLLTTNPYARDLACDLYCSHGQLTVYGCGIDLAQFAGKEVQLSGTIIKHMNQANQVWRLILLATRAEVVPASPKAN